MNVAEVLDLRRSGLGYRTIAKQLGISRDRVLQICHKYGLGGQIAEAPNVTEEAVADYVKYTKKSVIQQKKKKQNRALSFRRTRRRTPQG